MKKYWKVKYGYNSLDNVSVSEQEIEKAIYAQIKGQPVQIGNAYVNGRNIISIVPDYNRYTGWNPTYQPESTEDFAQIKRDCPPFDGFLEAYKNRVANLIHDGLENQIGKLPPILTLESPKTEVSEEVKQLADKFKV